MTTRRYTKKEWERVKESGAYDPREEKPENQISILPSNVMAYLEGLEKQPTLKERILARRTGKPKPYTEEELQHIKDFDRMAEKDEARERKKKTSKPEAKPSKKSELSKEQSVALSELLTIRRKKAITKEEYETCKERIKSNRSVKIKYFLEVPKTFVYKRMKGEGIGDSSSSEDESTSSSDAEDVELEGKIHYSSLPISDDEYRKLSIFDIKKRYGLIQTVADSFRGIKLRDLPDQIHEDNTQYKAKLKRFIKSQMARHPDVSKALKDADHMGDIDYVSEEEVEGEGVRPDYGHMLRSEKALNERLKSTPPTVGRGRGRPKKSDTIHIDINSHNVKDGKYTMGDGIISRLKGGALTPDDLIEMRQMLDNVAWEQRKKAPKNILSGIEQGDVSKFLKTVERAKEGMAGSKESLEYARKALKERLAREVPRTKTGKVKEFKTKKEKEVEEYNRKAKSSKKKIFKSGTPEAKEYMAHLRSLRRKK